MTTSKPIRIFHVITGLGPGGAERQLANLVLNSDPTRVRHTVVSLLDDGIWGDKLRAGGVEVLSMKFSPGPRSLLRLVALANKIRSVKPDLVQTWLYHADLAGTVATWLAGRPPIIWSLRSSTPRFGAYPTTTKLLIRLLAILSRNVAALIANSEDGLRWHQSVGFRASHLQVIANGIDCREFQPNASAYQEVRRELGLPSDARLVGNPSRHDPMKDYPTMLSAFARVNKDAWLLLAGHGTGQDNALLDRQIAAAGIDGRRVLRLGRRNDVPRILAALDVAVLSSSSEGFPNVVAEAMACGVPCVATDAGDTKLLIGDCGLLVPIADPTALADAIDALLSLDFNARSDLGQRARKRIESQFSVAAMVAAYTRLYENILASSIG